MSEPDAGETGDEVDEPDDGDGDESDEDDDGDGETTDAAVSICIGDEVDGTDSVAAMRRASSSVASGPS